MTEFSLNKPAGILVKTTCVDFPGRLAGSFFLQGCNLRCPYCYNKTLVTDFKSEESPALNTLQELFDHLKKRQGILTGLTISGGEALLHPALTEILLFAKNLGYKIKLDTNGTLPDKLEALVKNPELKPDFIAMDIKTSPSKYSSLLLPAASPFYKEKGIFEEHLKKSAEIISKYPENQREFRTVLVPGLVNLEDIPEMAQLLPEDGSWQFAQFLPQNCLDSTFNELLPYSDAEAHKIVEYARTFIPGSALR